MRRRILASTRHQSPESRLATVGVIIHARAYRELLTQSLRGSPGLTVVDLGDGGVDSLERLLQVRPHVALLDLQHLLLVSLVREVHRASPGVSLVALNQELDPAAALALFEAGLTGFVPASAGMEDVQVSILDALRGELHCPPSIAAALVRRVRGQEVVSAPSQDIASLTAREEQALAYLEQGYSNKEIAALLGVSLSTVKTHIHHVLSKIRPSPGQVGSHKSARSPLTLSLIKGRREIPRS